MQEEFVKKTEVVDQFVTEWLVLKEYVRRERERSKSAEVFIDRMAQLLDVPTDDYVAMIRGIEDKILELRAKP